MKRKILSILLIIFMLSASLIIIPVNAKKLDDGDTSWAFDDSFVRGEVAVEGAVYETLEEYLSVHYVGYENLEKSDITHLELDDSFGGNDNIVIKDLSGIYELTNLKELVLWEISNEVTEAALAALDFSRLTNIEKLYIEGTDITNLEIGELENLTYLNITDPRMHSSIEELYIELDLSKMDNLEYFSYFLSNLPEGVFADDIAPYIIPPTGYVVDSYGAGSSEGASAINFYLVEPLEIEVTTNKEVYEVGEKVEVTVSWDKSIQATEYVLQFNKESLEFVSASIEEDFYNTTYLSNGEISIAWVSLDEIDVNEMTFIFNAIEESNGAAVFNVGIMDVATGELDTTFSIGGTTEQTIVITPTDYIKDESGLEEAYMNTHYGITGFTLTDNKITVQDLLDADSFNDSVTVKVYDVNNEEITDTSKGLGTGSIIKLYDGEEVIKEFTVVIFGDVSGEGEITALDALAIIKARNNKITVSDICLEAGRVFNKQLDGGPNAIDALAIIKHLNEKYEIKQSFLEAE